MYITYIIKTNKYKIIFIRKGVSAGEWETIRWNTIALILQFSNIVWKLYRYQTSYVYVDRTNMLYTCNIRIILSTYEKVARTSRVIRDCKSSRYKTDTDTLSGEMQKHTVLHAACHKAQVYRKTSVTSWYKTAGWNDPPGRWSETVIVQSLQNAQIGYQRILPHAAAPIHTRFDVSTVLSAPLMRPSPRRGRENICAYFGSIGFPACGTRFLLKALPTPSQIRFVLRFIPGYRTTSDPFLIYTDASSLNEKSVYSSVYRFLIFR